jgi:uncharacterized protein (DUF427 family)
MTNYPAVITPVGHVEPVPRRIRAVMCGETVLDSDRALYVWEWANYPQYYVPAADVRRDLLMSQGQTQHTPRGQVEVYALQVGEVRRPLAATHLAESSVAELGDTFRFDWAVLDAWFEEDERVFVHPRNPYVRVDALRSTRPVRVEHDGLVLAESSSPVLVFETGLPTRYYLNRSEVDFDHLIPSDTVTECPYKGTTSGYWSIRVGETVHPDLAWTYDFPTRQLSPIAGLISFYNEKVDITLDGIRLERPRTHFFASSD